MAIKEERPSRQQRPITIRLTNHLLTALGTKTTLAEAEAQPSALLDSYCQSLLVLLRRTSKKAQKNALYKLTEGEAITCIGHGFLLDV